MNVQVDFTSFINDTNTPGSNKAGSYVRALKYLNVMLRECSPEWKDLGDVFEVYRDNFGIRESSALKMIQIRDVTETAYLITPTGEAESRSHTAEYQGDDF